MKAGAEGKTGKGPTDVQQGWNAGTMKNVDQKPLDQVNFKRKKPSDPIDFDTNAQQQQDDRPPLKCFLTTEELDAHVASSPMAALMNFGLIGKVVRAELTQPDPLVQPPQHGSHELNDYDCTLCQNFYNDYVRISSQKAESLEAKTQGQSLCDVWRDARSIRITATTAAKVPMRDTTDPHKFMCSHLYPTFRGNTATNHGLETEPLALCWMESFGNVKKELGIQLCRAEPWLSASPDGILDDSILIEVKSPNMSGEEAMRKLERGEVVSSVSLIDGRYVLNEKSPYFKQVQLTMLCTGLQDCKFVVFTDPAHSLVVDIPFSATFVSKEVERLKKFYFRHLLPRIVDDFESGRFQFRSEYGEFCQAV